MKVNVRRLVSSLGVAACLGFLVAASAGCGAMAMANPKIAWAVSEPTPLPIVVRRADAAQVTTKEVDRLLTATPTSASSDWLQKVGPDPAEAAGILAGLKQDPMYAKPPKARIVAAEVWIRTLPDVQSSGGDKPNLLAAIDPSLGAGYADIMAKKQEIADLNQKIEEEKAAGEAPDATPDDQEDPRRTRRRTREDEVREGRRPRADPKDVP